MAMRIELVAGATNVVRFPVERRVRPTMDLLRELAPDVREAMNVAESFGLSTPEHDARHTADAEMADHIMNHVRPEPGPQRRASLEALLEPVIVRAVTACRAAHDTALAAMEAQQRVVDAQSQGGYWLQPLEERAETLTITAAQLLVEAHLRSEEAEGANRAVRMAMHGETWMPFVLQDEAEGLFFGGRKIG
jgi:hypothetical protein